ncbi:MAG: hypothetical protein OXD30_10965 [Bryobacterales bacterium]|nr:hypothetical protein [Bryobacterales bacterium]
MAFPPIPARRVTASLSALLDQARFALSRLDGALGAHADAAAFVTMQRCREAVLSSRIENAPSALAPVLAPALDHGDTESGAGSVEAVRCRLALEDGLAAIGDKPLSPECLAAVQATLGGPDLEAAAELAAGLAALDEFLVARQDLPDLVRIGTAQAQLPRLLPAGLADGRLERIAGLAMFRRLGIPGASALALSPYFQARHASYRASLLGPAEPWLSFFVKGVAESAAQAADMIRCCADLAREHRAAISAGMGHAVGRGLRVFDRLTAAPIATVSEIRAITGTSYVAANHLVAKFAEMGILDEITGYRRNRRFQYGPYVRIFDPGEAATRTARKARPVPAPPRSRAPRARPAPQPKPSRSPLLSEHLL